MLDKLVESKFDNKENRKLRGLLITTSTLAFSGVVFTLIFSLFSQNLAMGSENIDLSTLITPPKIAEEKPVPPVAKKKAEKTPKKNLKNETPTRKFNILRLDESPHKVPTKVSTKPSTNKARPKSNFKIGAIDKNPPIQATTVSDKDVAGEIDGNPFVAATPKKVKKPKETVNKPIKKKKTPPPLMQTVKKPKKNVIVTKGVINGIAKRLVKPGYPAAAKTLGIKGKVTVQVLISENGKVIAAKAIGGHQLLKRNAVSAARKSTFTPTLLSNNKVKVRGVIVYNFK